MTGTSRPRRTRLLACLSVGAALSWTAGALPAGAQSEGEYGRHVARCAQQSGFDRAHHPGMHQGHAGWHEHEGHCTTAAS